MDQGQHEGRTHLSDRTTGKIDGKIDQETDGGPTMTRATDSIDPQSTTVHEAMQEIAGAGDVFRRFGLDTCCGGELPLATAAEHHDVELERLLEALDGAGNGPVA